MLNADMVLKMAGELSTYSLGRSEAGEMARDLNGLGLGSEEYRGLARATLEQWLWRMEEDEAAYHEAEGREAADYEEWAYGRDYE